MKPWSRTTFAASAFLVTLTVHATPVGSVALETPLRILAEDIRFEDFAVSLGGERLAGYTRGAGVSLMDLSNGQMLSRDPINQAGSGRIAITRNDLVATGGPQGKGVLLCKPPATEITETFTTEAESITAIAFSSDGQLLAAADQEGLITVWKTVSGERVCRLDGHLASVGAIAFAPSGGRLVSAGDDNDICIWDTTTGRLLQRIDATTHTVFSLAWSRDGDRIYAGGASCTITIWDVTTGNRTAESAAGPHVISSLAISPDGRTVAAGGFNPESSAYPADIRLVDATTLAEQRVIHAHSGPVAALGFTGDHLLSASPTDPGIKVWSIASSK